MGLHGFTATIMIGCRLSVAELRLAGRTRIAAHCIDYICSTIVLACNIIFTGCDIILSLLDVMLSMCPCRSRAPQSCRRGASIIIVVVVVVVVAIAIVGHLAVHILVKLVDHDADVILYYYYYYYNYYHHHHHHIR